RYVAHDSFVAAARKLKDNDGRPLWVPSMTGGAPSTINGHPYTVDNNLAPLGAGSTPAVFGDIKEAYLVRVVNGAQTLRLTERYADFLQVGFLGFQRLDGKVQNASAARKLEIAAV